MPSPAARPVGRVRISDVGRLRSIGPGTDTGTRRSGWAAAIALGDHSDVQLTVDMLAGWHGTVSASHSAGPDAEARPPALRRLERRGGSVGERDHSV